MSKRITLISVVILMAAVGLLPVLVMLVKSVTVDGHVGFENYKGILTSAREWSLLKHSFALSILTTLLATSVGLPLGIVLGKTDLPFRRLFAVLFTVPLLVPPYITAVSWFDLLGRDGILTRLIDLPAMNVFSVWLFGLPGCVLVLFSTFQPIVMLLTMTYLKTVNPRLEEAGKLVAGWPGVLRGITIPVIMPGTILAAMLVFLLTFGEFGVPTFLRYDVFPVESFTQFSAFYNFGAGTAAAVPLAAVTLLILIIERIFLRERVYQLRPVYDAQLLPPIELGRFRKWCVIAVSMLCLVVVVVPLLVLVFQSLSVNAYAQAISRAGDSLVRSLLYAAVGASALTLIGFFFGYMIHYRAIPIWRSVDSMTIFLLALPSTVTAIGLISLWNTPATNFVYATPLIIIMGYLARYLALTSRITVSTLAQIPPSMEESAQILGAAWPRRMISVVAPLAMRGLAAGWLVGFIFCMRDMGISMMVYPPGHDTFPVRTFTLMANAPPGLIAALCVIMIVATLLPLVVFAAVFRRKRFVQ